MQKRVEPEALAALAFASASFKDSSGSISGDVYVISAKTNAVTNTIPIGGIPGVEVYDSVKGEIFVANSVWNSSAQNNYSHVIEVISDGNNKISATINLPISISAGPMAYNPDKGEIYINEGTSVAIISDKTNSVVGTVNTNGNGAASGGIAYDSGTNAVYAVNNGGVPGSLAVVSDPSSGTSTSSPTSTVSSSPNTSASIGTSSTPKVPEFSNAALISVAAAIVALTLCTVALTTRARKLFKIK